MIVAHGSGLSRYDELGVVGVLLVVLALAVLQVRHTARTRAADAAQDDSRDETLS